MNKAIFLDRDGVINTERGYTHRVEDFSILPDVAETLRIFMQRGYLLIVVTNQSGIAKELYRCEDVEAVHRHMTEELGREGIRFEEVYYCKHHPDTGKCICRKPDSLFVEKALARFDIDPAKRYFIGDKERDVQAAAKAGVEGILVESNSPLKNLLGRIV